MKRILVLTIAIIISFSLCSCNNAISDDADALNKNEQLTPYSPLIIGYSDSLSLDIEVEYKFASPYDDSAKNIKDSIELEINGTSYFGTYDTTSYLGYNYFPTRKYIDNDKNIFAIDDSGKLTSYFWGISNSKNSVISQNECVIIAKDFLRNMVDVDQYDINVVDEKEKERYSVKFKKNINGFETSDCATININYDGTMYSYSSFMLGKIPCDIDTSDINIDRVKSVVKARLDSVYEASQKKYDEIRYEENSIILTVLKEGYTGIVISYDVDCINKVGEFNEYEQHFTSVVTFVVPIKSNEFKVIES